MILALLLFYLQVFCPISLVQYQRISTFDYEIELNYVFDYIKWHEGFTEYIIDDVGYPATCYGCRLLYINEQLEYPVTRQKCDSILADLFYENMGYIKYHFPELENNQLFALSHLSYAVGIGQMLSKKVYFDGKLNQYRLYNLRKVDRTLPQFRALRVWEYKLFYKEYPDIIVSKLELEL